MISGRKTQIVVRVDAKIAANMFLLPSIAEAGALSPDCLKRIEFSKMIIDASTIIPIPRINPDILTILTDMSNMDIHITVNRIQIGIDSEIIRVGRIPLRNRNIIMAASITPNIALLYTSPNTSLMFLELSRRISI